jgi:hypothetical protein
VDSRPGLNYAPAPSGHWKASAMHRVGSAAFVMHKTPTAERLFHDPNNESASRPATGSALPDPFRLEAARNKSISPAVFTADIDAQLSRHLTNRRSQ